MVNKAQIFKALADNSRLMIVNFLLTKESYVDEISRALNLAPSTVSFHLKKLEEASMVFKKKEQYYTIFTLKNELFNQTLKDIVFYENPDSHVNSSKEDKFEQKIIYTFMQDGVLTRLPAQYKKRMVILDNIASGFTIGEQLSEPEVNERISRIYHDYCTIRRMFIDEGYMSRENGVYTVIKSGKIIKTNEKINIGEKMNTISAERKKEIKLAFKEKAPEAGAYLLKNKVNGKRYIGTSVNLPGIINRYTFLLTLGKHDNRQLQDDWNSHGKAAFEFSILEKLKTEKEDNAKTLKGKLEKLEEKWHTLLIGDKSLFYNTKIKIREKTEEK